ncbi:hypothetical protein NE237_028074 [Protea cynaroides]|uniref:Reticulon domain-containing protein n=1 Tax=Protea cynaroides TaxID=273540 RepID=A0A9Q0JTR0_9MAGN|nr:hypothetical protein NE237_028074 [Protea cynaroides]
MSRILAGFDIDTVMGSAFADTVLWKRWSAGAWPLVTATAFWFLFERVGYSPLSLVTHVLFLLVVILFLWAKSASLLNSSIGNVITSSEPSGVIVTLCLLNHVDNPTTISLQMLRRTQFLGNPLRSPSSFGSDLRRKLIPFLGESVSEVALMLIPLGLELFWDREVGNVEAIEHISANEALKCEAFVVWFRVDHVWFD